MSLHASPLWGPNTISYHEGGGRVLYADFIKKKCEARCPGLHFDLGGRHGIWHPYQDVAQGVRYFHKHICSMDRGEIPQFTIWSAKEQMVRVSVSEAARQAIPLIGLDPGGQVGDMNRATYGYAMKQVKDDIIKIGWMELFHHLCVARLPGITPEWIAETFRVDMGWFGKITPDTLEDQEN